MKNQLIFVKYCNFAYEGVGLEFAIVIKLMKDKTELANC